MSTLFTKIINKEIPAQFVYEDDVCVVVMDKFPTISGQTLVVPKLEVDYAFDLPEDVYSHIFSIAQKIVRASDKAFGTFRTCLVVEGFEVPHTHIKLYPMVEKESLGAALAKTPEPADEEILLRQAKQIKMALK